MTVQIWAFPTGVHTSPTVSDLDLGSLMSSPAAIATTRIPLSLQVGLWIAQILVGVPFMLLGFMKLTTPIPKLAGTFPWTGQLPESFVRCIGVIDIAGGLGMLLPALTRVKPKLTVWAALGCSVLQVCAIVFHTLRGEISATPGNYVFLGLSLFVLWGRMRRAPIPPRT